jgi:acyl-coenzyme A synthetase/AMP-(fatty) acid ligase
LVGRSPVFSTVPHTHLYGLLFSVLWPLAAERCFYSRHILHVDELVPRMLEAECSVLVSSPTALKQLARHTDAEALRGSCQAVFSSGGPLATESAHAIARRVGRPPIEVLGSTETGGIAWRTQDPMGSDDRWTPFDSVDVSRDLREAVVLEVREDGLLLRGRRDGRLSWEATYREAARERESWRDLEATLADGLDEVAW